MKRLFDLIGTTIMLPFALVLPVLPFILFGYVAYNLGSYLFG